MHTSSTTAPRNATPAAPRPAGAPARDAWYAKPVKVFDNLYFVGQTEYSAWAVMTSEGIIVIDPIFDYSVEEEVVNGLKTLGADPSRIKYVLISHAHSDHVGGASYLQDRFGRRRGRHAVEPYSLRWIEDEAARPGEARSQRAASLRRRG